MSYETCCVLYCNFFLDDRLFDLSLIYVSEEMEDRRNTNQRYRRPKKLSTTGNDDEGQYSFLAPSRGCTALLSGLVRVYKKDHLWQTPMSRVMEWNICRAITISATKFGLSPPFPFPSTSRDKGEFANGDLWLRSYFLRTPH